MPHVHGDCMFRNERLKDDKFLCCKRLHSVSQSQPQVPLIFIRFIINYKVVWWHPIARLTCTAVKRQSHMHDALPARDRCPPAIADRPPKIYPFWPDRCRSLGVRQRALLERWARLTNAMHSSTLCILRHSLCASGLLCMYKNVRGARCMNVHARRTPAMRRACWSNTGPTPDTRKAHAGYSLHVRRLRSSAHPAFW